MKILVFTEASSAGVGRHVIDLVEGLEACGDECHLLYGAERMDQRFASRAASLPHTRAIKVAKNPGPSDLAALRHLRHYIRLHGPFDILHAHSTKAGLLLRLAAIGSNAAVLYTPHAPLTMNPRLPSLARFVLARFEVALAFLTDRVIAVSREEAEHLALCGIPRRKLSVVANGIEPALIIASRPAASGPVRIGFLGRLSSQKNVNMLLEAFAIAFHRDEAVTLAIGGTGPDANALHAKAEALGISDRVNWLGRCTADAMSTFDIFALPSSYEGMPYVLLEALAGGLPIVATGVGGVRSVIEDGVDGLVVAPGDTAQFGGALRKLATDGALRQAFSHAAISKAASFTLRNMVDETNGVYRQSVQTSQPSRVAVRNSAATAD